MQQEEITELFWGSHLQETKYLANVNKDEEMIKNAQAALKIRLKEKEIEEKKRRQWVIATR